MSVLERVADIWRVHDLRRKILITILLLAVCRVGVYVPVPGVDAAKIVAAAVRLFCEKGYEATAVREIVEAAGVTKPVLYYYFRFFIV